MSVSGGPDIITDGLILSLDAANNKSYSGSGSVWGNLAGVNSATLVNSPIFSNENKGILQFNGSNQYAVSTSTNASFTALTFIVFFNRITNGANGAGILFNRGGGGNVTGMNICYPNLNNLGYHWNDTSETYLYDSGLSVPLNVWSYCALSVNSTSALFCVNGNFVNRVHGHGSTSIGGGLQIAADPAGGRYYQSNLALACLYNKALSPAEILQNYNATKSRFFL
jgi:hypothetical protein